MFEWFAGLDPQVQSGWIAGLTAMITTVLTVGITQFFASRNLKKTLAENRETARETIEANRTALDRTLKAEAQKHQAELKDKRADRQFERRLELRTQIASFGTEAHEFFVGLSHEQPEEILRKPEIEANMSILLDFDELGSAIYIMRQGSDLIWERVKNPFTDGESIIPGEDSRADDLHDKIFDFNMIEIKRITNRSKKISETDK